MWRIQINEELHAAELQGQINVSDANDQKLLIS